MQQRYYDAEVGRFLAPDPVLPNPETGANFNRYWYADNNPVRYTDPDGREAAGNTCSRIKGGSSSCSGAYGQVGGNAGVNTRSNSTSSGGKSGSSAGGGSSSGASNVPDLVDTNEVDLLGALFGGADVLLGTVEVAGGTATTLVGVFAGIKPMQAVGGIAIATGGITVHDGGTNFANAIDGGNRESAAQKIGRSIDGDNGAVMGEKISRMVTFSGLLRNYRNIALKTATDEDIYNTIKEVEEVNRNDSKP